MKLSKQRAINLHRILWDWLAKNPTKEKEEWPGWIRNGGHIESVLNGCFLCEYVYTMQEESGCKRCPLQWPQPSCHHNENGLFSKWWKDTKDLMYRKCLAEQIRDLPVKGCKYCDDQHDPRIACLGYIAGYKDRQKDKEIQIFGTDPEGGKIYYADEDTSFEVTPPPICFYHKSDLDGKCSAAIVKHHIPDCELYGMQYGDPFPWDKITPKRQVYMVDFSLPEEDMVRLTCIYAGDRRDKFVWIDHHKTALEMHDRLGLELYGITGISKAACELVWYWFHPGEEIPRAVYLLGRYDVWDHSDRDTLPFQYGMRTEDTNPISEIWREVIFSHISISDIHIQDLIECGHVILRYNKQQNAQACEQTAFFVKFFEGLSGVALNMPFANSQTFDSVYDPKFHDVMIAYHYDGEKWIVHLYTTKDIDVSEIAKKYGGGGHKKAAGFTCKELPEELK